LGRGRGRGLGLGLGLGLGPAPRDLRELLADAREAPLDLGASHAELSEQESVCLLEALLCVPLVCLVQRLLGRAIRGVARGVAGGVVKTRFAL